MEKGTSYLLTQKTYMNADQFMFIFKCLDCPKREITCFFTDGVLEVESLERRGVALLCLDSLNTPFF